MLKELGCVIKNARNKKKISQRELARRTGIPNRTISLWESGGGDMPVSALIRVAGALDSTASEMVARIEVEEANAG